MNPTLVPGTRIVAKAEWSCEIKAMMCGADIGYHDPPLHYQSQWLRYRSCISIPHYVPEGNWVSYAYRGFLREINHQEFRDFRMVVKRVSVD